MLMCQKQQLSWWCRGGQTDLGVEGGGSYKSTGINGPKEKKKDKEERK